MKRAALLFCVLAACGGKPKAEPTSKVEPKHDEHANLPAEVVKFHDLLSPRWHAEKGPQRTKDTCTAVADFAATADSLVKLAPPTGSDATKWTATTKELADAVVALKTTCDAHDDAAFEEAFHHVHVGFHHVAETAGGEAEHHEGHEEGHEE